VRREFGMSPCFAGGPIEQSEIEGGDPKNPKPQSLDLSVSQSLSLFGTTTGLPSGPVIT
jgi:hypothetical protein